MTLNESKTVSSVTSINILGYCVGKGVIKPDSDRLRPLQESSPPGNIKGFKRVLGLFAYYANWVPGFSEKIQRLKRTTSFPLDELAFNDFNTLKGKIEKAALHSVDENVPFLVECDRVWCSNIGDVKPSRTPCGLHIAFTARLWATLPCNRKTSDCHLRTNSKMGSLCCSTALHVGYGSVVDGVYARQSYMHED